MHAASGASRWADNLEASPNVSRIASPTRSMLPPSPRHLLRLNYRTMGRKHRNRSRRFLTVIGEQAVTSKSLEAMAIRPTHECAMKASPAIPRNTDRVSFNLQNEKELDSLRDRLNADDVKVADTFSTIVRTVATGLTLITYTFLTSDKISPFVRDNFEIIRAGSIIGLVALIADALQYAAALMQIAQARRSIQSGRVPETIEGVIRARTNKFLIAREFFFWSKAVITAGGACIIIYALSRASLTVLVASS